MNDTPIIPITVRPPGMGKSSRKYPDWSDKPGTTRAVEKNAGVTPGE
jgi:hypothetical protein